MYFSKAIADDESSQATNQIPRSIISDSYVISESDWVLALVRKKGTDQTFLLLEGQRRDERKFFRSDLFLAPSRRAEIVKVFGTLSARDLIDSLWSYSSSSCEGAAFIKVGELEGGGIDILTDIERCEYQSWNIAVEEASLLLCSLIKEAKKHSPPYPASSGVLSFRAGSDASASLIHNCFTWYREVVTKAFTGLLVVGEHWENLSSRSEIVAQAKKMATLEQELAQTALSPLTSRQTSAAAASGPGASAAAPTTLGERGRSASTASTAPS